MVLIFFNPQFCYTLVLIVISMHISQLQTMKVLKFSLYLRNEMCVTSVKMNPPKGLNG